jgi:hypothetical protein
MIRLFSLSAAGLLLAVSSVGTMAQMTSPPPSTTMSPGQGPYSGPIPGQAPNNTPGTIVTPGADVNAPGNSTDNPTLGNTGAAPGSAANPNR